MAVTDDDEKGDKKGSEEEIKGDIFALRNEKVNEMITVLEEEPNN